MKKNKLCNLNAIKKMRLSFFLALVLPLSFLNAQSSIIFSGRVYDSVNKNPVEFATVAIVESSQKTKTDQSGAFQIILGKPAAYTAIVSVNGMQPEKSVINITENTQKDFYLKPLKIQAETITIKDEKIRQKTGRQTLSKERIKEIPGSMNDSISALNSLAGVERYGGIFGYLVMRGANSYYNRYTIDGIPVVMPQHFLGIHSVLHNDFIEDIDIYASLPPVSIKNGSGPLIQINTIDDSEKSGIAFELGILSANIMIESPLNENVDEVKKKKGYFTAAARIGYLSVLLPPIIKLITGDDYSSIPDYYDYQSKIKYNFTNSHSLTLLFFGAGDKWNIVPEVEGDDKTTALEEGADPFSLDMHVYQDFQFHTQSFKYAYLSSYKLKNEFLFFSTFNRNDRTILVDNPNAVSWLENMHIVSKPNIYGLKNNLTLRPIKEHLYFKAGAEANFYDFSASGTGIMPKEVPSAGFLILDIGNENLFTPVEIDVKTKNTILSVYAESEIKWKGLSFVPGIRADYFVEAKKEALNPRGILSYNLKNDTEFSFGMGRYESFLHENVNYFSAAPMIFDAKENVTTEKSIQRTAGIKHKFTDEYSVKAEGYYNYYYDLAEGAAIVKDGVETYGQSSGETKNYGVELTMKKEAAAENNILYGWLSYTYNAGKHKTNLPLSSDPYGDKWLNNEFARKHTLKLIAGYKSGEHKIGARFQLYSSNPYTPIVGDDGDPGGIGRYAPVYGERFSKYYPVNHSLDIRYTKTKKYGWGSFAYYVEFLNIYNNKPLIMQDYRYNQPYQSGVNPALSAGAGPFFAGNFGLEIRF